MIDYITTLLELATADVDDNRLQNAPRCFLSRAGSKRRIASQIIDYFPEHSAYIEPFFGSGGLFLQIPDDKLAPKNVMSDLDGNIINLFTVISKQETAEAFVERLVGWIHCEDNFKYAKKYSGDDAVERAVCYYVVCRYSIMGLATSINRRIDDLTAVATNLKKLHTLIAGKHLTRTLFANKHFRELFDWIVYDETTNWRKSTFVYSDPPYIDTDAGRHYDSKSWSVDDLNDLIEVITKKGFENFAISERLTDKTKDIAKKWGLTATPIKNDWAATQKGRQEVLFTSYIPHKLYNQQFNF